MNIKDNIAAVNYQPGQICVFYKIKPSERQTFKK